MLFNDPTELVGLLDVMLPKQCAKKASGIRNLNPKLQSLHLKIYIDIYLHKYAYIYIHTYTYIYIYIYADMSKAQTPIPKP